MILVNQFHVDVGTDIAILMTELDAVVQLICASTIFDFNPIPTGPGGSIGVAEAFSREGLFSLVPDRD